MPKKQTSDTETYADVKVLQDWRKSVDSKLKDIDKKLSDLPDTLIEKLDERYASKEKVEEIEETVAPLTTLRRRLWTIYLLAVFSVGGILAIGIEYLRNLNK